MFTLDDTLVLTLLTHPLQVALMAVAAFAAAREGIRAVATKSGASKSSIRLVRPTAPTRAAA